MARRGIESESPARFARLSGVIRGAKEAASCIKIEWYGNNANVLLLALWRPELAGMASRHHEINRGI